MKKKQVAMMVKMALLFALALPSALMADSWDKSTKLTFSEPVEVPGMVLLAGMYWFTLADSESDRNVVEIWNADRTQLITRVLAISDYRLKPAGKTIVHFEERPSGSPEAIHSWFYPGANYGEEFVYPKERAMQLAKQVSRPVLSMPDAPTPPAPAAAKVTPVKAVSPSGEEIEITEIIAETPEMPTEAPATASEGATPKSLPQTGSSMPLLGLAGLLSIGASLALKKAASRAS